MRLDRPKEILEILLRSWKEDHLSHAYIFSGPESPVKVQCVELFASQLFAASAESDLFGGKVASPEICLERIKRRNHPDFVVVEPENGLLSVDRMRDLKKSLSFAPLESTKRVVIVSGAETLNAQAANSVLKLLEEPPPHTMFFLFVRDAGELLQTIVSRCQVLRFFPVNHGQLAEIFSEKNRPELSFDAMAALSEGSLDRANKYCALEGGEELRKKSVASIFSLWENSPRIPYEAIKWIESIDGEGEVALVVDTWEICLRDLAMASVGASQPEFLFSESFPYFKEKMSFSKSVLFECSEKSQAFHRFRVSQEFHGNMKLGLLSLFCDLQISSLGK